METINKLDDEKVEVVTENREVYNKVELEKIKTELEKQLSRVNTLLDKFK